jgi:hypothetical protein
MNAYTISATSEMLNVTTVRVHGLIKSGKLVVADEAAKVGNKFVKAITEESIQELMIQRANGQTRSGSRQYIITLEPEQVELLQAEGYELKPRFTKKVKVEEHEVEGSETTTTEEVEAEEDKEAESEQPKRRRSYR